MTRHSKSMTGHSLALLAAAILVAPTASGAQDTASIAHPWRVGSIVGAWHQDYGPETRRHVGPFVSVHVGRQLGVAVRLTASVAYHRLEDARQFTFYDVTGASRTDVYDRDIVAVTAGISADLWRGRVSAVSVGFEAGPGWSRGRFDRSSGSISGSGSEPPPTPGWGPATFVGFGAPSLVVRHGVTSRAEAMVMGRLLMGIGDIQPAGIPVLGAGLGYRF